MRNSCFVTRALRPFEIANDVIERTDGDVSSPLITGFAQPQRSTVMDQIAVVLRQPRRRDRIPLHAHKLFRRFDVLGQMPFIERPVLNFRHLV